MQENIILSLSRTEFVEAVGIAVEQALTRIESAAKQKPKVIKGIRGLAAFIPCSLSKAQQLKNEGKIPFYQDGRLILFDPDQVREALKTSWE